MKTRSGLRESPVMTHGDKKEGRSAYNKQSENENNNLKIIIIIITILFTVGNKRSLNKLMYTNYLITIFLFTCNTGTTFSFPVSDHCFESFNILSRFYAV